jgi:RNA polymerase II subunit A-like phosphatase
MHDMLYGKICMDCKEVIDSPAESYATSSLVNPKVLIRETTAKMLETGMKNSILSENKLILVLDLDNTLIHATTNPAYSMTVPGLNSEYFEVNISGSTFYVKLRPNLHDFLQALSCYYKIYIFTAATKPYALAILQIIDPTSSIILPNNIITREELKEGKKDMSLILPYDYSLTIIVDDRVDSWSANSNILRVQS